MKTVPTITSLTCGLIRHNEKRRRALVYLEREIEVNRGDPWWAGVLRDQYNSLMRRV